MIEWLNQYIGADVATYLGVLLGVLSLLYCGKYVNKKQRQSQSGGENSINIQGGRDVKVGTVKK